MQSRNRLPEARHQELEAPRQVPEKRRQVLEKQRQTSQQVTATLVENTIPTLVCITIATAGMTPKLEDSSRKTQLASPAATSTSMDMSGITH